MHVKYKYMYISLLLKDKCVSDNTEVDLLKQRL